MTELLLSIAAVIYFQYRVDNINGELHRLREHVSLLKNVDSLEAVEKALGESSAELRKDISELILTTFEGLAVACVSYSFVLKQLMGYIYSRLT